jgi:hypothetical protein
MKAMKVVLSNTPAYLRPGHSGSDQLSCRDDSVLSACDSSQRVVC